MTFNPAGTDFRPCPGPALMTRLEVEHHEPVDTGALKVVLSRPQE